MAARYPPPLAITHSLCEWRHEKLVPTESTRVDEFGSKKYEKSYIFEGFHLINFEKYLLRWLTHRYYKIIDLSEISFK